jgi:hypothetical protein
MVMTTRLSSNEQHPDGNDQPRQVVPKIDGTKKPLVQGNDWYNRWVSTKIMLVQTHRWYKETIGT